MQKTYTIKVDVQRNGQSDEHFNEFLKEVKERLADTLPSTKGVASAQLVSITEK